MQAWLADLLASDSAPWMEPTFRSRMQMQVHDVTGLALSGAFIHFLFILNYLATFVVCVCVFIFIHVLFMFLII